MDSSYINHIYTVSDAEAFRFVSEAARKEGLLVGSSSGAALYAALKKLKATGYEYNCYFS